MIVKLREIVDHISDLRSLSATKFSPVASYRIAKMLRIAQKEIDEFREHSSEIASRLGIGPDSTPDEIEKLGPEIDKAMNEILDTEVEIRVHPVRIEDCKDSIAPGILMSLSWVFEDDENGEPS